MYKPIHGAPSFSDHRLEYVNWHEDHLVWNRNDISTFQCSDRCGLRHCRVPRYSPEACAVHGSWLKPMPTSCWLLWHVKSICPKNTLAAMEIILGRWSYVCVSQINYGLKIHDSLSVMKWVSDKYAAFPTLHSVRNHFWIGSTCIIHVSTTTFVSKIQNQKRILLLPAATSDFGFLPIHYKEERPNSIQSMST